MRRSCPTTARNRRNQAGSIISGNIAFPYTDDPSGLAGWTMTGIYPDDMAAAILTIPRAFWHVQARMGWPAGLCEGSFYQTDDGVLHMLLRTTGPGYAGKLGSPKAATMARPGRRRRRPPSPTTTPSSISAGCRDGRFYYVGCPDPEPRGARNPLVLSLSARRRAL